VLRIQQATVMTRLPLTRLEQGFTIYKGA